MGKSAINNYDKTFTTEDERTYPLAFVYDGIAYYYAVLEYDDTKTTIMVDGKKVYTGQEASDNLVKAIHKYGAKRGEVWIAHFFRDCVAHELGELKS
jgi:hypothetical protein